MNPITLKKNNSKPVTVGHIGTVIDVIEGHIPQSLAHRRFNAEDFKYGFELGTPKRIESLGETVIVNGYCFTTSTDKSSPDYYQTMTGREFSSSGVFLIPKGTEANYLVDESFSSPMTLKKLYELLYKQVGRPYALAGFFEFETLHCTAIAKAPIFNENIFDHQSDYYSIPPQTLTNVSAYLVAAAADYQSQNNELFALLNDLEVVLYNNPFDSKGTLTTHAHGITFNQPIKTVSGITPESVDKTWHIFAEKSRLKAIHGEVFIIDRMENLQ